MIETGVDQSVEDPAAEWLMVAKVLDGAEAELDAFVTSVADRALERIRAAHGELSAGPQDALHRGVRATVRDALARLRSQAELPQELPPDLIELARLYAGSRAELPDLADALLVSQEVFWDHFEVVAERTLGDTALCWDVIKAAWVQLRGHAARVSELFRSACRRESARAAGIDGDSRLRAVSRALDGHWVDPGELGYDLAYHHVALVTDSSRPLDALARRPERQLLVVQAPDGGTWAWLGGREGFSDSDLDELIEWHGSRDGRVAFGEPGVGIAGFVASHHQALEASTIAAATDERAVRFADLRLLIAVMRDDDLAKGFIERELGELAGPSERMHELRATLRAYLEHSQSVVATAAFRRRDRKTIQRQLRSAERLIQHPASKRSDELLIALRVAEILRQRD